MIRAYKLSEVRHVLEALGCELKFRKHDISDIIEIEHPQHDFLYYLPSADIIPFRHLQALSNHLSQRGITSNQEFFRLLD